MANSSENYVTVANIKQIGPNEDEIKYYLYGFGPVMAGVNAKYFQDYTGGVINLPYNVCIPDELNHVVTIVGYGVDENGVEFWKFKNSWGTTWGENGYGRIARGTSCCGINLQVYRPENVYLQPKI